MKPGTFTQLYAQLVFAVRNRENMLYKSFRARVFEYIAGILKDMKHKPLIVNGISDHVHILYGMNPSVSISDTVHDIKRGSSLFINQKRFVPGRFTWQEGYGAFSYSRIQIRDIYGYIENQEIHHSKRSFREEYMALLEQNEIEYDPLFLFDFIDDLK